MIEVNDVFKYDFAFTQDEVVQFAEVTGDKNPVHLNADYAAQTMFKRPIMHGFLSGSVFSKVFGMMFPGEGTIYLKQNMAFLRPMYVDTEYEAIFTVTEVNREKHQILVETKIVDKSTQKETIQGEALVMHQEKI